MEQAILARQQHEDDLFYRVIVSNFKYDWGFAFVTRKPKF